MPLTPGTTLGPYEIQTPLGAGGMGEVYKARDTRLDRIVAIKVLPEHVAADPALKQRFEREAKTVAALSHPHICPVFDVGSQDGIDFLVMEYLDGETLAQRLEKGALPLDQALEIAIQIADALDKAHRQGIVHRDLKPGNIMLAKGGAKLLDFGLAKLKPAGAAPGVSAPTVSAGLTGEGSILGTLQYMAPEQLEGQEADARTDIFAFGMTVYEMVTGAKAFEGKSQASLIAAILEREPPPMSALEPQSPSTLDRVVKKCLAKNPEERWHTAHDLHDELTWIAESDASVSLPASTQTGGQPALWRRALPSVAAAVVASAIVGLTIWSVTRPEPAPPEPAVRSVVTAPPSEAVATGGSNRDLAISPDGSRVVYTTGSPPQLYVRPVDQLEGMPLRGTEGARGPFFSPDGNWVGFADGQTLKKISVLGGPTVRLCPLGADLRGASWGPDDTILFGVSGGSRVLFRVSAAGGEPEVFLEPDTDAVEVSYRWPEILPGGRAVLFTIEGPGFRTRQIGLLDVDTGEQTVLISVGSNPSYASTGHIVYGTDGTLRAVPFDLDRLAVTGDPVPVVEAVMTKLSGAVNFSLAGDGSLVYVTRGTVGDTRTLVWVDREGREEPLAAEPRPYGGLRLSPDGRQVAIELLDPGNRDLLIYDLARATPTRFTFDPAIDTAPIWSPDGERVAFASNREGLPNLFWKAADGTGDAERLTTSANPHLSSSWSPDGQTVVFYQRSPETVGDVGVLSMDGERATALLLSEEFEQQYPEISPDGRWLAYTSNESGQIEIYVRPFPNVDAGKWQISRDGGNYPLWAPDGRELFYRRLANRAVMVVPIDTEPTFSPGNPDVLFDAADFVLAGFPGRAYDISPDGRFLMVKEPAGSSADIILVLNWLEELLERVPVD